MTMDGPPGAISVTLADDDNDDQTYNEEPVYLHGNLAMLLTDEGEIEYQGGGFSDQR